jgi:hypothetical protein
MKPRRRRVLRWTGVIAMLAVILLGGALWREDVTPWTADQIRTRVDEINQAAGITLPHDFDNGAIRRTAPDLFTKVERNAPLTDEESARYRVLYQGIILSKQALLRRFDRNLTVMIDVEMDRPNNVGGYGIAGSHDHHDASVRSNLADLDAELAAIHASQFTPTRVLNAILAYKDLSDILAHLATISHTKSTPYRRPAGAVDDVTRLGEDTLGEFKTVQFASVNGPEYWTSMFRALDAYDRLVLRVQNDIDSALSPIERKLAGRWGSVQSLGPWLAAGRPARRYR